MGAQGYKGAHMGIKGYAWVYMGIGTSVYTLHLNTF